MLTDITGSRSVELALHAEFQGALGVVLNIPTPNELIKQLKEKIDIPVIITVVSTKDDIKGRIDPPTTSELFKDIMIKYREE